MSEKTLDQLIESLKSEAIDAAENASRKILDAAKQQAEQIVKAAEEKRTNILSDAEKEAQDILQKGENALQQAGRDYTISVRNQLLQLFQRVLLDETQKSFTPDLLKTAILNVIEHIGGDSELKLSGDASADLADYIHQQLQSSDKVVSITKNNAILKGFAITPKDQGWSYTITPEEVAQALKSYLNPKWINILNKKTEKK